MKPKLPDRIAKAKPKLYINPTLKVCEECSGFSWRSSSTCELCQSPRLRIASIDDEAPKRIFIALGPEPSQGRGTRIQDALQNLWDRWPPPIKTREQGWVVKVWEAHAMTTISGRGGLRSPEHTKPPKLVREYKSWPHGLFIPLDVYQGWPGDIEGTSERVLVLLKSVRVRTTADRIVSILTTGADRPEVSAY